MINIPNPENRKWSVSNGSDLIGNIYSTKNINFDETGYIGLSPAPRCIYSESLNDQFDRGSVVIYNAGDFFMQTWDEPFTINSAPLKSIPSQITATDFPNGGITADACWWDNKLIVSENADVHYLDSSNSTWTDTNISLSNTSKSQHPITHFVSLNKLAVANVYEVKLYSTMSATPTLDTTLALPNTFMITSMKYFNGNLYIGTRNEYGAKACLFVWNGTGTSYQQAFQVDSHIIHDICVWQDSIVILSASGALSRFNGGGFDILAGFPIFYTAEVLSDPTNISLYKNILKPNEDVIYISFSKDGSNQLLNQPSGLWCYDPEVGLYHKYSYTHNTFYTESISPANIDLSTNIITVTTAPFTGSVTILPNTSGVTPLVENTVYYVIKLSDTTIKLATTYSNALAGTTIDLTAKPAAASTSLNFYKDTDYGITHTFSRPACIDIMDKNTSYPTYGFDVLYSGDLGARDGSSTDYGVLNVPSEIFEARGYFETSKVFSTNITDIFNKFSIKYRNLSKDQDKIIVKYRTIDDLYGKNIINANNTAIWDADWTSTTTFTTTYIEWANAVVGNEITVLSGAGAGLLAHITEISVNAGTYTITIDETFSNYTSGDGARIIFTNWNKLLTITKDDTLGYKVVQLGVTGKFIQFKIELRGFGIKIEEIKLDNVMQLPAK